MLHFSIPFRATDCAFVSRSIRVYWLLPIFIAPPKKLTWNGSNLAAVEARGAISSCDDVSRM